MWIGTAILLVVAAAMPALAAQDKPDANGKAAPAAEQKKTAAAHGKKDASPPQGKKSTTTTPRRVTEADGKTYEFRETPFGLMKFPVKTEDAARETSADAFLKIVEEGDSLRFRRQTPFGVTEWVRKKSELNDTEKQAWERELRKSESSAPVETKEGK
jgi:hypothetical protein